MDSRKVECKERRHELDAPARHLGQCESVSEGQNPMNKDGRPSRGSEQESVGTDSSFVARASEGYRQSVSCRQCAHCGSLDEARQLPAAAEALLDQSSRNRGQLVESRVPLRLADGLVTSVCCRSPGAADDEAQRRGPGEVDQGGVDDPSDRARGHGWLGTKGPRDDSVADDGDGDQQGVSEEGCAAKLPDSEDEGLLNRERDDSHPEDQSDDDGLPAGRDIARRRDGFRQTCKLDLRGDFEQGSTVCTVGKDHCTIAKEEETDHRLRRWVRWLEQIPDLEMVLKLNSEKTETKNVGSVKTRSKGSSSAASTTEATMEKLVQAVNELTQEVVKSREERSEEANRTRKARAVSPHSTGM